ncbi:glycosyltransferase family 4 protein [Shewanella sp.]|uniref:glycosyltransferase family 4 protein n=1 Tax=Shewanella sp. TaxID=50422 RepID=UPI004047EEE8
MQTKSVNKIKVNIVVGARFNASKVVEILAAQNDLYDVVIYTSSKRKNWKIEGKNVGYVFIPHFSAIISGLFKFNCPVWFDNISSVYFDWITSLFMRRCDILHAWSSYCLKCIAKAHNEGSFVLVDKACPHPVLQNKLLKQEGKILGVPFVENYQFFLKRILFEFNLADMILVPSDFTFNSFLENNTPRSKLKKIFLDANFTPKKKHVKNCYSEMFVVGVIGGSVARKGYIYLVRAWSELRLPNAKLLLKVSETELSKYSILYKEIKADPSIEIVGYLDDIESFYERCNLFCLPSIDEGFGMVVLESIACSTPVITTRNVGASELVIDGINGYVVYPFDHIALAEKLEFLFYNRNVLKKMSDMCLNSYESYSSSSHSYRKELLSLYQEIASKRLDNS